MALTEAQRIFGEILSRNLAPVKPMKPLGPYRPLPKNLPPMPPPTPPARPQLDAASFILKRASVGNGNLAPPSGQTLASMQEDEEPSVLTKIFDTFMIPLNTAFHGISELTDVVQGEQSVGQALQDQAKELATIPARIADNALWKPDLPGEWDSKLYNWLDKQADKSARTTGSDLLENIGVEGKAATFGGLGLDLAADPLNWIPLIGWGRAGIKAADKLTDAATGAKAFTKPEPEPKFKLPQTPVAEEVTGASPRNSQGLPGPANFGRHRQPITVPPVKLTPDNTREGGRFHGTINRWANDEPRPPLSVEGSAQRNLFGPGIYTTRNREVANSYSLGGFADDIGETPTVYNVKWTSPVPPVLYDLDGPPDELVVEWGRRVIDEIEAEGVDLYPNQPEWWGGSYTDEVLSRNRKLLDDVSLGERQVSSAYVYLSIKNMLDGPGVDPSMRDRLITHFTENLMDEGWDGLKHTGGNIVGGFGEHEVNIFFSANRLNVDESTDLFNRMPEMGAANVAGPEVVGKDLLANPFHPRTAFALQQMKNRNPRFQPTKANRPTRSESAKQRNAIGFAQEANLAKRGTVVALGKGGISVPAVENVVNAIRRGEISPEPPPVAKLPDDDAIAGAKRLADGFITKYLAGKLKYDPKKQVKLYKTIVTAVRNAGKGLSVADQQNLAISSLRVAEDHLINLGKIPQHWNGQQVRLSDVLAETEGLTPAQTIEVFAKTNLEGAGSPLVKEAIYRSLARRSIIGGASIGHIAKYAERAKNIIDNDAYRHPLDKARVQELLDSLDNVIKNSKMTDAEKASVKDVVRQTINFDKLPTDTLNEKLASRLIMAVSRGDTDVDAISAQFDEIAKMFGVKSIKEVDPVSRWERTVTSFMTNFTTWWGRKDILKYEHDIIGWGEGNARRNAMLMRSVQKRYNNEEQRAAWLAATGREAPDSPRIAGLANFFKEQMEWIFGSSGLKAELAKGTVDLPVAYKSQTALKDINKELARIHSEFKFTNKKKFKTADGRTVDYSKGSDWLNSWENFTPTDPAAFLYDVNLAMERVTKRYAFLDDLGQRFGMRTRGKRDGLDYSYIVPGEQRLSGYYFPKEIAEQAISTIRHFDDPQWRSPQNLKWYTGGLRAWKMGVTIYNPVHHVRNMIGDSWLMWLGGINDPRVFTKAQRVIRPQRKRYRNVVRQADPDNPESIAKAREELGNLLTRRLVEVSDTKRTDVISKVGKHRISAEEYYIQAHRHNLLLEANQAEDLFGATPFGGITNIKPIGATHSKVTALSEYREHYVRLAHFIGATEKNLKKGMSKQRAYEIAAHDVRKWHPDGRDLTNFEQNLRLIIPFYSWLRKSTPLVIQSLAQRPAKVMAYPKIQSAIQQVTGVEGSIEDPFPDDQLFPDWIRAGGIGPIGDARAGGLSGFIGNLAKTEPEDFTNKPLGYAIADPGNPFNDFVEQFGGLGGAHEPAMGLAESLTPAIRVPIEFAQQRKFTGQPLSSDPSGYVGENIPFVAPMSRIFNYGPLGQTRQGEEQGNFDREALINWLTGLGLRGTGPYAESAEFDARDRAKRFAERKLRANGS